MFTDGRGTGDLGWTSRVDGTRVCKDDDRVEALGDMDELQSWLGLIQARTGQSTVEIRESLSELMSVFSGLPNDSKCHPKLTVCRLERMSEKLDSSTNPVKLNFAAEFTSENKAMFNVARTICRRAERSVWRVYHNWENTDFQETCKDIAVWLNRLSDYLYLMTAQYD